MNYQTVNVENIGYSRPIHNNKGGYNLLVNYAGKKPITIRTPIVECPYGVDVKGNDCSMKLRTNDETFLSLLQEIDETNTDLPEKFGLFSETLKDIPNDSEGSETNGENGDGDGDGDSGDEPFYFTPYMHSQNSLRVRLPIKYGRVHGVTINSNDGDSLATIRDIVPGTKVQCVLEWKNVWIIDRTFGYFWNVTEINIHR